VSRFTVLFFVLALCVALAQSGETVVQADGGRYLDITPEAFRTRLETPGNYLLVNTHIPYEGELPGTELFLPFDQVDQLKDLLPRDKATEILVYCRSGRMSTLAAETLVKLGYTNVKNLVGGMIAWEATGYTLETLP
jgi:phage shock protein E